MVFVYNLATQPPDLVVFVHNLVTQPPFPGWGHSHGAEAVVSIEEDMDLKDKNVVIFQKKSKSDETFALICNSNLVKTKICSLKLVDHVKHYH